MNCDEALQILLAENHEARTAALTHVLADRSCLDRIDQLTRAILSNIEHEISCAETRLHIADYYEWQHHQAESFPLLQDVQDHLERCPYCQLEYQVLQEAMKQLETLPVETGTPQRSFDLSFINAPLAKRPQAEPAPVAEIWRIENQVRRLFEQIQVAISDTKATIASLSPQLVPALVVTPMRNKEDLQFVALVLPAPEANIHFQVDIKPSRDDTAQITLKVFSIEQNTPIPNTRVTLRTSEGALIAGSLTNSKGEITFPRVAADRYLIQTQYQDKTWELPISIIQAQPE